eukprot:comp12213_c0_seq1/m.6983 comp12213_c0_seq1/g.6983  ORF comp12213_c0_seq1/g.6983 comp12213_c0_seq1/m.6983 type:complete len:690 (-) comp12213_c0_seq1:809-2878(-)
MTVQQMATPHYLSANGSFDKKGAHPSPKSDPKHSRVIGGTLRGPMLDVRRTSCSSLDTCQSVASNGSISEGANGPINKLLRFYANGGTFATKDGAAEDGDEKEVSLMEFLEEFDAVGNLQAVAPYPQPHPQHVTAKTSASSGGMSLLGLGRNRGKTVSSSSYSSGVQSPYFMKDDGEKEKKALLPSLLSGRIGIRPKARRMTSNIVASSRQTEYEETLGNTDGPPSSPIADGAISRSMHSRISLSNVESMRTDTPAGSMPSLLEMALEEGEVTQVDKGDGIEIKTLHNGHQVVVGGRVEKLVERLTDDGEHDVELFNTFLATFRHVTTPTRLLELLLERFETPLSTGKHGCGPTQLRTVNFVCKWMERQWLDFESEDTLDLARQLAARCKETDCKPLANRIEATISAQVAAWIALSNQEPPRCLGESQWELCSLVAVLLTIAPSSLALTLTLTEMELMRKIRPDHIVVQLWSPRLPHASVFSSHLNDYIAWFNRVSQWATLMVLCADEGHRPTVVDQLVRVAKCLQERHNYNTLYALIAGLSHGAVRRIKSLWEVSQSKTLALYREMEGFMDPARNFHRYRTCIKMTRLPAIPVMGVLLRDLTFLNEMPRETRAPGWINFFKLRAICTKLTVMQEYQRSEYNSSTQCPLSIEYCLNLPTPLPDVELYNMSYAILPRSQATPRVSVNTTS